MCHYPKHSGQSIIKIIKTHFHQQCRLTLKQIHGCRLTRVSFGALPNKAQRKETSEENVISVIMTIGVYSFNPNAMPDYAFSQ